jgi:hypothetical protein
LDKAVGGLPLGLEPRAQLLLGRGGCGQPG